MKRLSSFLNNLLSNSAGSHPLTLELSNEKNCWIALPDQLVKVVQPPLVFKLECKGQTQFAAWGGATAPSLQISRALANTVWGWSEGDTVQVSLARDNYLLELVRPILRCQNQQDWDIVGLEAQQIIELLATQIGVLYDGQKFPFWYRGSNVIYFVVEIPERPGQLLKLQSDIEVEIAPSLDRYYGFKQQPKNGKTPNQIPKVQQIQWVRVILLHEGQIELSKLNDFQGIVTWGTIACRCSQTIIDTVGTQYVKLKSFNDNQIVVQLISDENVPIGHVLVTQPILEWLEIQNFSHVQICPEDDKATSKVRNFPEAVIMRPIRQKTENSYAIQSQKRNEDNDQEHQIEMPKELDSLPQLFNSWIIAQTQMFASEIVLPQRFLMVLEFTGKDQIQNRLAYEVKLSDQFQSKWFRWNASLKPLRFGIGKTVDVQLTQLLYSKIQVINRNNYQLFQMLPQPFQQGVYSCIERLESQLHNKSICENQLLGSVGVMMSLPVGGIREMATAIACQLGSEVTVVTLECRDLVGQPANDVKQIFSQLVQYALLHWPCVVVLQYLERVCTSSEGFGSSKRLVIKLLREIQEIVTVPVAVVALCQDSHSLRTVFKTQSLFSPVIEIKTLNAQEKAQLLLAKVALKVQIDVNSIDIDQISTKLEGFADMDYDTVVTRALHLRQQENGTSNIGYCLLQGLQGFVPSSYWGIQSDPSQEFQRGVSGWEDVGGLKEAINTLNDALLLPLRSFKFLAKAPLRLRTGVLLYGPPGCGKTHLMKCAAAVSKCRVVTVAGPELLNKYVGASEEAVRSLFAKARSLSPCVLFFDEFEALAPRRGHDSTGVMDRMVNQLLTELDGIEDLKGVCVAAATSRPDLLDPALLRPGRLDHRIYCGFPTVPELEEIISVQVQKISVQQDFDIRQFAVRCEGLTGADIQALFANAQLLAIHEVVDQMQGTKSAPSVEIKHLDQALEELRPSVPQNQRKYLEQIYETFAIDGGNTKLPQHQIVTLA